ncbi:MAG: hypothetical protein RLZZ214_4076 [Verrucomicrobiota bacterium]
MTDGRLVALIVPALGRVMSFRKIGGTDCLWQMPLDEMARHPEPRTGWRNWGGDRTWLAPQSHWPALAGRTWPPDTAWGDAEAGQHMAQVSPDGRLRVIGPLSEHSGTRLIRDFGFSEGNFTIQQTVEKFSGPPAMLSLWSVACAPVPEEVVVIPNPSSAYPGGRHLWPGAIDLPEISESHGLLHIRPARGHGYKLGFDSPYAAIAAVSHGDAFVLRAAKPAGDYPDGATGSGFPVEYYTNGTVGDAATEAPFVELELLGPLVRIAAGEIHSHTVQWRLLESPTTAELLSALERHI